MIWDVGGGGGVWEEVSTLNEVFNWNTCHISKLTNPVDVEQQMATNSFLRNTWLELADRARGKI